MNDHAATQLARVAAALEVSDADAVTTVTRWAAQRDKIGRPIGSTTAVLAQMTDHEIRSDLQRYVVRATPTAPPCPDCTPGDPWVYDADGNSAGLKCRHPNRAAL